MNIKSANTESHNFGPDAHSAHVHKRSEFVNDNSCGKYVVNSYNLVLYYSIIQGYLLGIERHQQNRKINLS